jgi:hypothetical protein
MDPKRSVQQDGLKKNGLEEMKANRIRKGTISSVFPSDYPQRLELLKTEIEKEEKILLTK